MLNNRLNMLVNYRNILAIAGLPIWAIIYTIPTGKSCVIAEYVAKEARGELVSGVQVYISGLLSSHFHTFRPVFLP